MFPPFQPLKPDILYVREIADRSRVVDGLKEPRNKDQLFMKWGGEND